MELTPTDIRNFEFPAKVRGYDKDAVDKFREEIADRFESLKQENLKLSMEAESLRSQLSALRQFEDAIKNAAIDARRNADTTVAEAKKQAAEMLAKARVEAEQSYAEQTKHKGQLEADIVKLDLIKRSYLAKMRTLISSHMEWIEDIARVELPVPVLEPRHQESDSETAETLSHPQASEPVAQEQEDRLDVTESTEVTAKQREHIATEPSDSGPIQTEEANAASRIVTVDQISTPADRSNSPIDPELAAALNNYQKVAEEITHKASRRDALSDTAKVEVPRGYIAKVDGEVMAPPAPTYEHNSVNIDTPVSEPKPAEPDNLSVVLDNVVHKFEEEMDKAARS